MRKDRLEALVDGTLAIALTLLVLLIEPPPADQSSGKVMQDVLEDWNMLLAFALSFVLIGMYWLSHYAMFHHINRCTLPFVWLNLMFLLSVVFIPFPTALLVEYPRDPIAVVIYACAHLVCSTIIAVMWFYAARDRRLIHDDIDPEVLRSTARKLIVPPVLYIIAIFAAFWTGGWAWRSLPWCQFTIWPSIERASTSAWEKTAGIEIRADPRPPIYDFCGGRHPRPAKRRRADGREKLTSSGRKSSGSHGPPIHCREVA